MKKLILLFPLLFSACSTIQLSENAKKVTVVQPSQVTLADRKKLEEIGPVSCKVAYNGRDLETNIVSCKNELRNKASEMGATLIITETWASNPQYGTYSIVGTAFKDK